MGENVPNCKCVQSVSVWMYFRLAPGVMEHWKIDSCVLNLGSFLEEIGLQLSFKGRPGNAGGRTLHVSGSNVQNLRNRRKEQGHGSDRFGEESVFTQDQGLSGVTPWQEDLKTTIHGLHLVLSNGKAGTITSPLRNTQKIQVISLYHTARFTLPSFKWKTSPFANTLS